MPTIVETVLLCAKQQIALQVNHQDKVDLTQEPMRNEGNLIATLKLLTKNNETLNEHLMFDPRNAKYASKTIQNEMRQLKQMLIRFLDCKCLRCLLIIDEVTGKIKCLSV